MLRVEHALVGDEGAHAAGRQLLARLYRQETGRCLPEIAVGHRGKPYFPEDPLHFSITHTKHHVFCALSDKPVGIDAEETDRQISPRLAERILSESEMERYARAADKRRCLLKLWVLKEAAGKRSGEGINGFPNRTDFSPEDERVKEMFGCFVAVVEENG